MRRSEKGAAVDADLNARGEYGSSLDTAAEEGEPSKSDNYSGQTMTAKNWVSGDLRSAMSVSGHWVGCFPLGLAKSTALQNYPTPVPT